MEMRLKCKSIGLALDGPTDVYCDNQGVVKNTSIPESMLSKKRNAVNCHIVREAVAADAMRVGKEDTNTNPADASPSCYHTTRRSYCWEFCSMTIRLGTRCTSPSCRLRDNTSRGLFEYRQGYYVPVTPQGGLCSIVEEAPRRPLGNVIILILYDRTIDYLLSKW